MNPGDGTIAAIATPPGRGGLGMVRISGPEAAAVTAAVFRAPDGRAPGHARATFGVALDSEGSPLDHGVLTFFHAPRSHTGEDTAEISIHGSPFLLDRLLGAALDAGARPAAAGEFTYRAFRNGRLDLAQAEAVADLVETTTAEGARVAFRQAEGALSRSLAPARAGLVELIAVLEAGLEFSEEDGTDVAAGEVRARLADLHGALAPLAGSFRRGRLLRRGATAVLAGAPNVGKSSLFNRLLGEERAIVTPVPGTTRDLVGEPVELDGIPVQLLDTAGLAEPDDPIEAEGVRRADEARREADLVLFVTDRSRPIRPAEVEALRRSPPSTLLVRNKSDLPEAPGSMAQVEGRRRVVVSARTGEGVEELRAAMAEILAGASGETSAGVPLTRERQHREVARALESIGRAAEAHASGAGDELVLVDLHAARSALGSATGEVDLDEIYDAVFATFCIGK